MELKPEEDLDPIHYEHLFNFYNYEHYLDSLVTQVDKMYLKNRKIAHEIVQMEYRNSGNTLTEDEFYRRRDVVSTLRKPPGSVLASLGMNPTQPLARELALREHKNRTGELQTIIYIRRKTKAGYEVAAYIDYAERLRVEHWEPFFEEKITLKPKITDIGYYNWGTGVSRTNSTQNFKVVLSLREGGLKYQSLKDSNYVCVDAKSRQGKNTTRTNVFSKNYEQIILFDHVVEICK